MNRNRSRAVEGGYALIMTALMMIPLLAFAAIGVDVGVWYLQAQKNQRVADAAALAGVVWLPNEAKARSVAFEAIEKNGLKPGIDATVSIDRLTSGSLRVSVSNKSELSFSRILLDEFAITRASVAEYNPPVAVGSPSNQLGDPTIWLAVSGYCSVRENGDLRSARWIAAYPSAAYPPAPCTGSSNPTYDNGGYLFAVDIPAHPGGAVDIEVYDAAYNPSSVPDLEFRPPSGFNTTYELYAPGGSPFDLTSHPIAQQTTVASGDASYFETWRPVLTISDPQPGLHFVRVRATGGGSDSFGSNGFALRAKSGGTFAPCSSITDSTCVKVSAVGELPLYAALSNGSSTFYLAEVEPTNAGKKLIINLFDVGEGADLIEVLDPNGNPAQFTWETDCTVGIPLGRGCSGSGTSLDVSGADNQIYADTLGTSRFNDREVKVTVDLPTDYAARYAGDWWQIRYTFGADITDRTTWSVTVVGDPVRLAG